MLWHVMGDLIGKHCRSFDISKCNLLPKQAWFVQSQSLQETLEIRQRPWLPVRLRRGGAAAGGADTLRVVEGNQHVRGELGQAVQTQVHVHHVRRPFVELGHALGAAQHPGRAALREGQVGLGQRNHVGHLAVSRLVSSVAARDVLEVVRGRVVVRHLRLVLQQLDDQALVGVGVSEHFLVVRDLPQLADVGHVIGEEGGHRSPKQGSRRSRAAAAFPGALHVRAT